MAYTAFDGSKPDPTTQGITAYSQSVRDNEQALRDAVIAGALAGFNMTQSGGTAEQPANILFTKSTEIVKLALTWGSSGGEDGNVTQIVASYSSDSGAGYDTIGTATFTYDSNAYCTAITWS